MWNAQGFFTKSDGPAPFEANSKSDFASVDFVEGFQTQRVPSVPIRAPVGLVKGPATPVGPVCTYNVMGVDGSYIKSGKNLLKTTLDEYMKNPVILKVASVPQQYDLPNSVQSPENKARIAQQLAPTKILLDMFTQMYFNRKTCTPDFLKLANAYADKNGLMSGTSEQGQFEALHLASKMSAYTIVIHAENHPKLPDATYSKSEDWLVRFLERFAPTLGGRSHNQYVYYLQNMMQAGILKKNRANIQEYTNLLVKHMRCANEFLNRHDTPLIPTYRDGWIQCELFASGKVLAYHAYYLGMLWTCLLIIKHLNISFPWNEFKDQLKRVCENLAHPSVNVGGDGSLVINYLKNRIKSYNDANAYNDLRTKLLPDGGLHLKWWNYFWNNGPLPMTKDNTQINVYGVIPMTTFSNAVKDWNTIIPGATATAAPFCSTSVACKPAGPVQYCGK